MVLENLAQPFLLAKIFGRLKFENFLWLLKMDFIFIFLICEKSFKLTPLEVLNLNSKSIKPERVAKNKLYDRSLGIKVQILNRHDTMFRFI